MAEHGLFEELFDLSGKCALITGGSKGLGREMALTYARAGASVAIATRTEAECVAAAEDIAQATGQKTMGLAIDVRDGASIRAGVARIEAELAPIDILVASAGINVRKDATDFSEEDWDTVLDINLKGAFLTAQAVLPGMKARKYGRIIFLGSILSWISIPQRVAYASSKAGVLGLTRTLALETIDEGICVNAMCPGPFATEINKPLLDDPEKNAAFLQNVPIGRWGDPKEIRGLALYLASPSCSFMSGSAILIDGGWTAR